MLDRFHLRTGRFKVGDTVSYKIECKQWSDGDSTFDTNNIIEFGEPTQNGESRKPLKALEGFHVKKLLTLDIECVRFNNQLIVGTPEFESWEYKRRKHEGENTEEDLQNSYKTDAALFSEFAKVVCVSIGRIDKENKIVLQSIYGHDEAEVLTQLGQALDAFTSKGFALAGFGVKGYDIPFLMRRMLVNSVQVPDCLDVAGAKPWEVKVIDINELWKSTGFYSASLLNVATAMGLPSPKSNIDGSKVSDVYYESEEGLETIARYCERDVVTAINILLRMFGEEFITEVDSKTFGNGDKTKTKGKK